MFRAAANGAKHSFDYTRVGVSIRWAMASVFDAEPRWSGVKRILTVPPHQYVSLKDLPPLEDAPLVGRRRGVRTKRSLTIMPLTPDGEAWGGDDIASISSIMVARHRESFASTRSPLVGVKSAGKAPGPVVVTPVTLPALLGSPVGEPSSSDDDADDISVAIDGEGRAGEASVGPTRSLIAMLQHRLRPYAHYVAAQKTEMANTIISYADVVARAGDPVDKSRISRDVGRTFAAFDETAAGVIASEGASTAGGVGGSDSSVMNNSLQRLLSALCKAVPGGYCQGMNFMGALALTQMDEESSFWICARLLSHHNMRCLYSHECPFLTEYLKHFYSYCTRVVPGLMLHFKQQEYFVTMFAVEWFTTLYAPCVSTPSASAVLDLILAGCDNPLFRVGAALLVLLETYLITMDADDLMLNLKLLVRGVEHTTLLITALSFPDIPDVLVTWLTHGYTPFTVGASLSTIVQRKLSSGSDEPDEEAASGLPSPTGDTDADVTYAVLGYVEEEAMSTPVSRSLSPAVPDSPTKKCCGREHLRITLARATQARDHTSYQMFVEYHAGAVKVMWTRYSKLLLMYNSLQSELGGVELPPFPGKKWIGSKDPLFIQQRRTDLNECLARLCCEVPVVLESTAAIQTLLQD